MTRLRYIYALYSIVSLGCCVKYHICWPPVLIAILFLTGIITLIIASDLFARYKLYDQHRRYLYRHGVCLSGTITWIDSDDDGYILRAEYVDHTGKTSFFISDPVHDIKKFHIGNRISIWVKTYSPSHYTEDYYVEIR